MLRFCSLGSGSSGNATLIEAGDGARRSRVLVDCGFSIKELAARLARAGLEPAELDAIFVTHEHADHIGSAIPLAKRYGLPLWMSQGTWRAVGAPELPSGLLDFARDGERIAIGALELAPYTVPHDAQEPLQLTLGDGAARLGILTDAGSNTGHLLAALAGCQALLLECNHDRELLANSRYPPALKARIAGRHGHLANDTSAAILAGVMHAGLKHVVAAHLSEQNNRPALARAALATVLGAACEDIVVADPRRGFAWLDVS